MFVFFSFKKIFSIYNTILDKTILFTTNFSSVRGHSEPRQAARGGTEQDRGRVSERRTQGRELRMRGGEFERGLERRKILSTLTN